MTLKEKINDVVLDWEHKEIPTCLSDAILAAIKFHMTSPEAVERMVDAYRDYGGGRYVEQPGWRESIAPLLIAASTAALGEE